MTQGELLIARLSETLGPAQAAAVVAEIIRAGRPGAVETVAELLAELQERSPKIARLAVEAVPELRQRVGLAELIPWLDLGVAIAGASGAAAIRYCKESPVLLAILEPPAARRQVLALALELGEGDPNVALEFLRAAPALLPVIPLEALPAWAEIGVELASCDYVLGIEFFKQSPAAAGVLPLNRVRDWTAFAMKLITRNSLGKTDYLGPLEFFRTSPAILGDIPGTAVRERVIDAGSVLADRDPAAAIAFLAESPTLLRALPSEEWRLRVLRYGALVGERDPEVCLAYLRRCPEVIALVEGGETNRGKAGFEDGFEAWFRGGMETLTYSPEGARAYFALETHKALASIVQALSGIPLRQIARQLKLFAQGLCGTDLTIQSLPDQPADPGKDPVRARVGPDGRTILLPAILGRHPTREENVRLYTIMTAHEAGHLEFGTYQVRLRELGDVIAEVQDRYGRRSESGDRTLTVRTLHDLFGAYPQPGLIRDLWILLEDARVEHRLRLEYPGLKRDLEKAAQEAAQTRSLLHGMSVREMIVDGLLLLSTQEPGSVRVPEAIAPMVERAWAMASTILTPDATAEDAIRLAHRLYVAMEQMLAATPALEWPGETPPPEAGIGAGPSASEETSGRYRPVTNLSYRGAMTPELVRDPETPAPEGQHEAAPEGLGDDRASAEGPRPGAMEERLGERPGDALAPGGRFADRVEEMLAVPDDLRPRFLAGAATPRGHRYDEWDGLIRDYRSNWCRVVEQTAPEGTTEFVEAVLAAHGPAIRRLRRYFEGLRPPGFRRMPGQPEGEEVDLDAAIRRIAERKAGVSAGDRIYIRREKRERDVAVAVLVDLSGSTSRQVEEHGRRVIDVEKEGLILLGEALAAVGDQHAVYGYSGKGRHEVDFVVVKDFDERPGASIARRIGSVAPRQQNRDGAAIRHASARLQARSARTRLLVLVSDGRPLDDGYADEYALEDTKMALREARMRGIHPFCITVDREAGDYLRRMYGEVRFLIIDRVEALPERLPLVYRRLTA